MTGVTNVTAKKEALQFCQQLFAISYQQSAFSP